MNQRLLAALLLTFSCSAFATDLETNLETILAQNDEAHGGDAYAAIDAVRVRLAIKEPTFEVNGVYTASREGLMRIDIYAEGQPPNAAGQRVFAEGLMDTPDGVCAWEWTPGKSAEEAARCVGETETAALRHGIEMPGNFYTLKDVRDRGATVELIGEVESQAGAEWHLRMTLPDGFARDYFIDKTSYRITRARDYRAFHPGIDPTRVTVETRYSGLERVDGVLRPMRQENVNFETEEWLGSTEVLEVQHNPEIPKGHFEPSFVPQVP